MDIDKKPIGHTPASLRARQGIASISAMLALCPALTRDDCELIEAGNETVGVDKLRLYGEAIRADLPTMVAAHALARTVPRLTVKAIKSQKRKGRKAS